MTSDAKVGMLLGLVFIFIIAFLVNGFPSFIEGANNNELTASMVNSQNKSLGIGETERRVSREVIRDDVRFTTSLPKNNPVVKQTKEFVEVKPVMSAAPLATVKKNQISASKAKQNGRYIVRDGDSLWEIASKRLGDGNRYVEIAKLNADVLDDEDTLAVGMRLRLPAR